jgi:hypothetical protein
MQKIKVALLALMVAGLLGANAAYAEVVEPPCPIGSDCDSHWMVPGDPPTTPYNPSEPGPPSKGIPGNPP